VDIKRDGNPDSNLNFNDQKVRVEKEWWSMNLCSLLFATLPHETRLPNE